MITSYAVIIYGILVSLGGLIGYIQAKSKPSLIAGGASGAIMVACGVLMLQGMVAAMIVALVVALALTVLFLKRFSAKRVFMPAGLMLVLSVLMSVVLITATMMRFLFGPRG
jgi:uncharacterized membrane protein (UPF0136 family)